MRHDSSAGERWSQKVKKTLTFFWKKSKYFDFFSKASAALQMFVIHLRLSSAAGCYLARSHVWHYLSMCVTNSMFSSAAGCIALRIPCV